MLLELLVYGVFGIVCVLAGFASMSLADDLNKRKSAKIAKKRLENDNRA